LFAPRFAAMRKKMELMSSRKKRSWVNYGAMMQFFLTDCASSSYLNGKTIFDKLRKDTCNQPMCKLEA
jgi:hypothetical protein